MGNGVLALICSYLEVLFVTSIIFQWSALFAWTRQCQGGREGTILSTNSRDDHHLHLLMQTRIGGLCIHSLTHTQCFLPVYLHQVNWGRTTPRNVGSTIPWAVVLDSIKRRQQCKDKPLRLDCHVNAMWPATSSSRCPGFPLGWTVSPDGEAKQMPPLSCLVRVFYPNNEENESYTFYMF